MEQKPKRRNKFLSLILWWEIDPLELDCQILNYDTLGWGASARKLSCALLLLSVALTIIALLIAHGNPSTLIDVGIFTFLAVFVFKGARWATMASMVLWTLEKGVAMYSNSHLMSVLVQLSWWALYMKVFWLAYHVGRNPSKPNPQTDAADTRKSA